MAANIFDSRLWIHQKGYEWQKLDYLGKEGIRTAIKQNLVLLPRHPEMRSHEPRSGLHRTFAHLTPTPERVLSFANKYGLLGDNPAEIIVLGGKTGERFEFWEKQICLMHRAVEMWDKRKDRRWLATHILFEPGIVKYVHGKSVVTFEPAKPIVSCHSYDAPSSLALFNADWVALGQLGNDLERAALLYVQWLINNSLAARIQVAVLFENFSELNFRLMPDSLGSVLWLQLAQAISGNKDFRQCETCAEFFEIAEGRSDRKYCSRGCRSKAWRERSQRSKK